MRRERTEADNDERKKTGQAISGASQKQVKERETDREGRKPTKKSENAILENALMRN